MRKEFLIVMVILSILLIPSASANRGSMIVGPRDVQLEESGQNAIVAWNGNEEIIILSTDMKSSESTLVLEFIPLPSNPTKVEEGSPESFTKLVEIVNRKTSEMRKNVLPPGVKTLTIQGVEITFHEKIGAHDITIVKVNDLDYFIYWINDFSTKQGFENVDVSSEFKTTISNYLNRNIDHFVFDFIQVNESSQTINPIIYRFKSDYLYYPLEITSTSDVGWSSSEVNVFLIAKGVVDQSVIATSRLIPTVGFGEYYIELTREELMEISPELEDLFKSDPYLMNVQYYGSLNTLKKDLMVYQEDISEPSLRSEIPIDYTSLMIILFIIAILIMSIAIYKSWK